MNYKKWRQTGLTTNIITFVLITEDAIFTFESSIIDTVNFRYEVIL